MSWSAWVSRNVCEADFHRAQRKGKSFRFTFTFRPAIRHLPLGLRRTGRRSVLYQSLPVLPVTGGKGSLSGHCVAWTGIYSTFVVFTLVMITTNHSLTFSRPVGLICRRRDERRVPGRGAQVFKMIPRLYIFVAPYQTRFHYLSWQTGSSPCPVVLLFICFSILYRGSITSRL